MMDRLTERIEKYIEAYQLPPFGREVDGTVELLQEVSNKLAEYEDLEELIGIPLKDLAEIFCQNIPEDCKHPHKAVVLTDDDVDRWEKYKDFATVFRKKMTETVCEFLSDKEEFGKWLDRNI